MYESINQILSPAQPVLTEIPSKLYQHQGQQAKSFALSKP
jgi:hypothetical protein